LEGKLVARKEGESGKRIKEPEDLPDCRAVDSQKKKYKGSGIPGRTDGMMKGEDESEGRGSSFDETRPAKLGGTQERPGEGVHLMRES